jgi:hypothetical protein
MLTPIDFLIAGNWKKVGISISGGADSALLGFLICTYCNIKELHVSTQIRCWKTRPWQRYNSLDVFHWLQNRFPNIKFYRHENFIPPELEWGNIGPTIKLPNGDLKSGNQIILKSFNEYIIHRENLDAWFAGVNLNPEINIQGALEDRNNPKFPSLVTIDNVDICHPFIDIRKDWIIEQYFKFNITALLNLTRSCEGEFENLNYKNYHQGQYVPICKECFWCKEKQWAVEKCKIT